MAGCFTFEKKCIGQLATLLPDRILNLSEVSSLSPECLIYLFYRDGQISKLKAEHVKILKAIGESKPAIEYVHFYRKGLLLGYLDRVDHAFLLTTSLSAWFCLKMAKLARPLGKIVEHPNQSQPNSGNLKHLPHPVVAACQNGNFQLA